MGKDNFYKNTFILTLSNIATGIFSFIFSVTLSRSLGAEGMGLYNLVMPVYNLFICIMSAGILAAISKISAIYNDSKDYGNLYKTIRTTVIFNLIWSIFITFIFFISNDFISSSVLKDNRTSMALKIICPAMVFITLSNILKGYFYGVSKVMIPAIIDIFEKGIRISVVLIILNKIGTSSMALSLTTSYIALCLGELLSLILLYIYYKIDKKNKLFYRKPSEGRAQLLFNVLVISIPLCINGIITNILSTSSALIVPRRLVASGIPYNTALTLIGKFTGMAMTIVFFPMVIIGSINTILIPDLSKSVSKKDYTSSENRIKDVLRLSFLLGICTIMICTTIPNSLGIMLFKRNDLGTFIKFASLSAPLFYTAITSYGILNGIGKHNILLRNSVVISVVEIILLFFLTSISYINILGYGITLIITSLLTVIVNLVEIKKYYELKISITNVFIYFLFSVFSYYFLNLSNKLIPDYLFVLKNCIIIFLGFSLFIFSIYYTKKASR